MLGPLLILVCCAAAAVGAALFRAALHGPAGVFFWLAIVLGFVAGHRWERAQARQRNRAIAEQMHARLDERLRAASRVLPDGQR